MFRLGGAVFLDVGRAWYEGEVPAWLPDDRDAGYYGVLSNVGVGLRLESTRTRGDRILHLDLGFPLRNGPDVRSVEVTLTAKQTL
jgi:outer membrane protein assembly factor BamA